MIETTLKCHVCGKELTQIDWDVPDQGPIANPKTTMTLECPDVHCNVVYDKNLHKLVQYTIFMEDDKNRRYRVEAYRYKTETRLYLKNGPRAWNYANALTIKRFLPFKIDKDGRLQGDPIFKKLRTLLTFS